MTVRKGIKDDAEFLARVVMEAVGEELCIGLADGRERLHLVNRLFTTLAADDRSQYSWRNSFIATGEKGERLGGIIAYDGADLHELRKAFAREANRILGWNVSDSDVENWDDEADKDEIYIDSIYVIPQERKRGIASLLLKAVEKEFSGYNKPLGLLVEPENRNALKTYLNRGFKEVGISNFFRTPMIHMQKQIGK